MSIGEALIAARQRSGLTVHEVSAATRIRETIVRDIEHDDFAGCGGDFYARGHIRAMARVVGVDARPLIEEYDAARRAEQLAVSAEVPEPMPMRRQPVMRAERRGVNWTAVLSLVVVAALALAAYLFFTGSDRPGIAADRSPSKAVQTPSHAPSPGASTSPSATPSSPPQVVTTRAVKPVSAIAFGPGGIGTGDDPGDAAAVIDGGSGTGWHSDWYTTAEFGGLKAGTGILIDLGKPVTVTSAKISIGQEAGANLQLRAGNSPTLAGLRTVATAADASGAVRLPVTSPVQARYVLVWFTKLPPDQAGTFMANVYSVRLDEQVGG